MALKVKDVIFNFNYQSNLKQIQINKIKTIYLLPPPIVLISKAKLSHLLPKECHHGVSDEYLLIRVLRREFIALDHE